MDNSEEEEVVMGEDEEEMKAQSSPHTVATKPQKTECELRMKQAKERIQRRAKINIWEYCCTEVKEEIKELNAILLQMGLPPYNYSKDKSFPVTDYKDAPNAERCLSKDYLDFYVFPYLLPAIQALILFIKQNRIFQCRICTFNPADFISEYLYNSNPRHPNRQTSPTSLLETTFAKKWLQRYPRPPLPKWMTMTETTAASIIQRVVRGYFVRRQEDVQEMRQFWKELQKEKADCGFKKKKELLSPEVVYNYNSQITDEEIDFIQDRKENQSKSAMKSHSQECEICARFNKILQIENDNISLTQVNNEEGRNLNPNSTTTKSLFTDKTDSIQKLQNTFAMEYKKCCFYPDSQLPFTQTMTKQEQFKKRHPSLSCIKQPRAESMKAKVLPLNFGNQSSEGNSNEIMSKNTTPE